MFCNGSARTSASQPCAGLLLVLLAAAIMYQLAQQAKAGADQENSQMLAMLDQQAGAEAKVSPGCGHLLVALSLAASLLSGRESFATLFRSSCLGLFPKRPLA